MNGTVAADGRRWRRSRLLSPHTILGAAIIGFGVASLTVWSMGYRALEATVAAGVVGLVTRTQVYRNEWLVTGHHNGLWLIVTSTCSSNLMLLPILAFAAWAAIARRMPTAIVLAGLVAGIAVAVTLNTARFALIALSWRAWGYQSIWATHDLAGTFISLFGTFGALVTQILVTGRIGGLRGEAR
jgi:exosortase/archaeosortase family protein